MAESGEIVGTIRLQGPAPPPLSLEIVEDRIFCALDRKLERQVVSVGPKGGVQGALVYLSDGLSPDTLTTESVYHRYEQRLVGCQFERPLVVVPQGSSLMFRSQDAVVHRVAIQQPLREIEVDDLVTDVVAKRVRLPEPGIFKMYCQRHPWEWAYVAVARHAYYTLTDEQGQFRLAEVPPGNYRLHVWHPPVSANPVLKNGIVRGYEPGEPLQLTLPVPVRTEETTTLSLELKLPGQS